MTLNGDEKYKFTFGYGPYFIDINNEGTIATATATEM